MLNQHFCETNNIFIDVCNLYLLDLVVQKNIITLLVQQRMSINKFIHAFFFMAREFCLRFRVDAFFPPLCTRYANCHCANPLALFCLSRNSATLWDKPYPVHVKPTGETPFSLKCTVCPTLCRQKTVSSVVLDAQCAADNLTDSAP